MVNEIFKNGSIKANVAATTSMTKTSIKFTTQDNGTAKLIFNITKDNGPLPLSSAATAKIFLRMADGSVFEKDAKIIDPVNGQVEYILVEEINHPGTVKGEMNVYFSNGQSMTVCQFQFAIEKTVKDRDIVPVAEYYVKDFNTLQTDIEQRAAVIHETVDEMQAKVDEFESTAVTLDPRLTTVEGKVNTVTTQLADTAKQVVDTTAGLSFVPAQNLVLSMTGAAEPRFLDNIGDGFLYGSNSRSLYRAASENGPWTLVKAFTVNDAINGIRLLGDGEVLLIRSTDGLWKSTGWATNPLTATWTQVLVTNGRTTQFSIDVDKASGWVSATTYINGDMTNSRYVWLSRNNGATFTQIFDMLDFEPTIDKSHAHMHLAVLDPYWNASTPRIWISYHKTADDPTNTADPIKRIKYSDDGGQTWVSFSNSGYQPVVGIATPEGMLFGSDEDTVGVYIVRRTANPADMKYELFYAIRENIDGIFGWATKAIKGANGAYHIAFRSSVAGYPGRVITSDGKRIVETLKINPATATDSVDLVDIVEYQGKLLASYYNTASGAGTAYKATATAPARGLPSSSSVGALEGGIAGPLAISAGIKSKAEMRGTAIGTNSYAALRGTAFGEQSSAGAEGVAIGSIAVVTGNGAAIGKSATADTGVSFGRNSTSTGDGTSIGSTSKSIAESVAIGSFADATKTQSTAVGRLAVVSGNYGVAVGALASTTGTGSIALGRNAKSTHDFSIAIGYGTQTTATNQLKIGAKHVEIDNISTPSSFPVTGVRLFSRLNGSSKTELCVLFPSGSAVVIATQS
ncbi:BppU family phage baseplate upper protein [Peribacillus simplex]|uniref:BppU family phage baseplate upper protein n=1 Tax=Peribacillus simplex TaxID=1478 RepID=UPI00339723CF